MSADNDPGWMTPALNALGVFAAAITAWAWKHTHKRIDDLEHKATSYVTHEAFHQHSRSRDERLDRVDAALAKHDGTIAKMFDQLDEAIHRTEERFQTTDRENRNRHETLLEGHSKILVALESLRK